MPNAWEKKVRQGSEVQSVLLDKAHFNLRSARKWIKDNDFKDLKVDETENYYRFRQISPKKFISSSYRTLSISKGIKLIVGIPMKNKNNPFKGIRESFGAGAKRLKKEAQKIASREKKILKLEKEKAKIHKKYKSLQGCGKVLGISKEAMFDPDLWHTGVDNINKGIIDLEKEITKLKSQRNNPNSLKWSKYPSSSYEKWIAVDKNQGLTFEIYKRNTSTEPYVEYQLRIIDDRTGVVKDGGFEPTLKLAKESVPHMVNYYYGSRNNPSTPHWASTIIQQMGGMNRLSAMIGVKQVFYDSKNKTVQFKFPNKKRSKPNVVSVMYVPATDLYQVDFYRVGTKQGIPTKKVLKTYSDVYNNMLIPLFEEETGLYLRFNNNPSKLHLWKSLIQPYERLSIIQDDMYDMLIEDEAYDIQLKGSDDGYGNPMEVTVGYKFDDDLFTVYGLGNRHSTYEIGDESYALREILRYFDLHLRNNPHSPDQAAELKFSDFYIPLLFDNDFETTLGDIIQDNQEDGVEPVEHGDAERVRKLRKGESTFIGMVEVTRL